MLGDVGPHPREVEDLADLVADHLGSLEPAPQSGHAGGVWRSTSSGSATWARCFPSAPGLLSSRRASERRCWRLAGGFEGPSAEGGIEELRGCARGAPRDLRGEPQARRRTRSCVASKARTSRVLGDLLVDYELKRRELFLQILVGGLVELHAHQSSSCARKS